MTSGTAAAEVSADINLEVRGALALITLQRPKALNALTAAMRSSLAQWFAQFSRDPQIYAVVLQSASPRAFSAGSDVREVIRLARSSQAEGRKAFADEYELNWRLECFSKPAVSLIDGMVMGGGVGISLYGTHRVAGAGYSFAMPETQIGLFPDVGVCHALSRMPGHAGQYLGLTGRAIGRADAYSLGLVTHCIASEHYEEIKSQLADAQPVDPLLDRLHQDPGPGELEPYLDVIARCFSAPDVEGIIARLEAETGANSAWAQTAAAELRARSPLSIKITQRHIATAATRDLREVLHLDYALACHCLDGRDFYEGVRAVLVDKDGQPRWQPASLASVSDDMVSQCFLSADGGTWSLPDRASMQAARA